MGGSDKLRDPDLHIYTTTHKIDNEQGPWSREWQPTPVILPEKFHGQRNLADYIPRGCKESGMTGQLSIPFLPTYDSDSEKMDKNILTSSSIPTNFPVPYPIIPSSPFRKKTVSLFKANPSNLYF